VIDIDQVGAVGYEKLQVQMNGLGTIVAMPQWYINFNLAKLLKYGKTTEGKSLQDVQLSIGKGSMWLSGKIDKMWTEVFVSGSTHKVKFILRFAGGSMDYYDLSQNPPEPQRADIAGLQFGFDVDLNRADVLDNASLPEDVKKRVSELLSYLGPGAFTVKQLFMDFENATLSQYDPSVTIFPLKFPDSAVASFPQYLITYLKGLSSAGGNILGYAIKVDNPGGAKDPVATFPPTDLQFATNRYTPSQNPRPDEWKSDLDTINFQMMTGGQPFPTNLPVWFGNFVDPADETTGWYGTISMAHRLFVQSFLLSRLAPLVTQYWRLKDNAESLDIGHDPATGTLAYNGLGGSWNSGVQSSHSHKSGYDADYNFVFDVKLSITPGSNRIVIQRNTDFDIKINGFTVRYSVPLTITVELQGVQDGKLVVATTTQTKQPDPDTLYGDPYGWLITDTKGDYSIWSAVIKIMDKVIENAVNAAMPEALLPNIVKEITENLNLSPFVFPGGAELFMANPVFNNEGDLMLGLQYK